uniref:Forkhead box protein M1 n=1 Tax=Labrus bergylta TaxID=56723 RepID=A0A3Q3GST6_9LABR
MRRSPRRPLILRRRKLPFQQNDPPAVEQQSRPAAAAEPPKQDASRPFPAGIRIMDHPTQSDTQVVVIPKTADLQSVIGALTAKGKECGAQGRNKFILLSENGSRDDESCVSLLIGYGQFPRYNSLTNIQWLGKMSTAALEPCPAKQMANKENQSSQVSEPAQQPMSERPPYSYMAMIQFAINSRKTRRMTLKEIYMWIQDHFPYFREVAKPGWKNSIRHNLSLHDMFLRETSPDGKVSYWTIRPEANRCLTLDQVYRVINKMDKKKKKVINVVVVFSTSERRIKPLLPRTESYFIPVQLPVTYMQSSQAQFPPFCSQPKPIASRGAKRVRIAPKRNKDLKLAVKDEPVCDPIPGRTPTSLSTRQVSGSRRKQRLVHSLNEEPVLLCPENTFFDSGVVSDVSTFQDMRDAELDVSRSPDREFSFKTPIKSTNHLTSSTPSKPPCSAPPEPWKVTPVGKESAGVLDFSPIRTPGGPAVTPRHDYTTFSFNGTPFKDWPLFSSPRELLNSAPSRAAACSRELLQAGSSTPANRSVTEGLVLDTMNDSLSKILVDISFSCMDDEDLGTANISWSEFIPQFK